MRKLCISLRSTRPSPLASSLSKFSAMRGIEAWDPLAVDPADAVRPFYTPGAPRAWALDLTWTF